MKNAFFIFLFFMSASFFNAVFANPESSGDKNAFVYDLDQLRTDFRELEQDYKTRINALEDRVKRSEEIFIREREPEKLKTFYGTKGSLMNPDISVIADVFYHFSDHSEGVGGFSDNDLYFREVELAIQGYIYPGVRAEFYPVWEVEEEEVEIEEAFANFLTLPFNSSLLVGRQRIRFGAVNPVHQHYRNYVDVPLPVQNFLGAHGYIDDGIDFSIMAPLVNFPLKFGFGVFDGNKELGEHEHGGLEEEEEEEADGSGIFESEPIEWMDHVFLAKIDANIPLSNNADISLGYHVMWDDNGGARSVIHNGRLALNYSFLNSYRKLLWENEVYSLDIDERDVESFGFYSLLKFNASRFIDAGLRYDWSEPGDSDETRQWALNPILTWHLTEASYVRFQYKYGEHEGFDSVNEGMVQFVWGLGPHTHALRD